MNRAELERRTKAIVTLLAIWNFGGNTDMITAYVTATKDIHVDVLEKTCKKLMVECESRPVPATILKAAQNLINEINGADILPWDEAWKEIEKEMHDTFVYGKPKFSRPEIEKAVSAFGWQELCEVAIKELPIVRAQLRDMYNGICENSKKAKINAYVLGTASLLDDGKTVRLMLK